MTFQRCVVCLSVACLSAFPASAARAGKPKSGKASPSHRFPWETRPTLEQAYARYQPSFCRSYPGKPRGDALKFSRQKSYVNVGDVTMDVQVWPIINKANEYVQKKGEHRRAIELYRRILNEYPEDLVQIAPQGIFIPASLYVQRKILRYPKKELTYYRMLYDPAAKAIYDTAAKRYSIFDYKDLVRYHLATSYGDDALFALGNDAVDKGHYDEARRYYERIVTYHGLKEDDREHVTPDRDQVWVRLAICYKHLAKEAHYRAVVAKIGNKQQETVARLLDRLKEFKYDAFQVLQNASRHYWREPLAVSRLEMGDKEKLMASARKGLARLLGEIPMPWRADGEQIRELEEAAPKDYFMSVASVDASYVVEARDLAARRIHELLKAAPSGVRKQYEQLAAEDLARHEGVALGERLLWCWPGAGAGRKRIAELARMNASASPVERKAMLWRLADLATACHFGPKTVPGATKGPSWITPPADMPAGDGMKLIEAKNEDPDMVRLLLPQTGDVEKTAHLLFVGGRKRRAYGNRFNVLCWNMKEDKKEWDSREILLQGKVVQGEGFEVGFEEVFIRGNLALVHGRRDVIALDLRHGTDLGPRGKKSKKWHFRVPLGFEIRSADLCGDVLVLCGRGSTVALSAETGEIIWDGPERGELYAGPFFHKDTVLSVRKSPAEVSFRKAGTGRLLCRLRLPGLTTNRKHPVYSLEGADQNLAAAQAAEATPVAFAEGVLAVTDGRAYHMVDVDRKRIMWSRGATKLDTSRDAAYRLWVNGGKLFVLKPYYAVLENAVLDVATGDMLWRRREGGRKTNTKLKKYADAEKQAPGGKAATGLVLSSMTFRGGKVYGIKYQMGATTVELVGMDPVTGKIVMSIKQPGYEAPEAYVEPSWSGNCLTVRVQDGNKFEAWHVDVARKKLIRKLGREGFGRLGEYGDASMVWQGPYQAVWAFEMRALTTGP